MPAILVSFLSFYQAKAVIKNELTRDMQTLSQTVADEVNRMMFERLQNVASWSQLAIMQEIIIDDVDKRLSIFLKELTLSYNGIYRAIYVTDANKKVVASSDPKQLNHVVYLNNPWFSHGLADKRIQFYVINNNVLTISRDIVDENSNRVIGQLIAKFNWQHVQNLLNAAVKKPASAALISEKKEIIASTSNWNKNAGYEMRATSRINNESLTPKWSVRVEKLHSVALAPIHRLGFVFLALLAITLVLATFLVTPVALAITYPIANLTAFVRRFKQGQLTQAPQNGPPELQALSAAFEDMMQNLNKAQNNLTRAAKLAVVGELAAAMSHEIRTPLGILRSSADLLLRERGLTGEGKEVLGFIISETQRLNKLVSTLIDAARPRAPAFAIVDIAEIINHALALLRVQAESKGIVIDSVLAEPVFLQADTDQMTQVFMNVLMNAIQILPTGGRVSLRLTKANDVATIEIADDGPGITLDNQTQVFEPFFTQRAGGVGLGLAIVRQIVESHFGEIVCSNSQSGGAQFTISLPINLSFE